MYFKIIILCGLCFAWALGNPYNRQLSSFNEDLLKHEEKKLEKHVYKRLAEVISKNKPKEWNRSNHPPLDSNEEIPVEVVYDGEESATEKSQNFKLNRNRSRGTKRYRNSATTTEKTTVSNQKTLIEHNIDISTSTKDPIMSTTTTKINQYTTVTSDINEQASTEKPLLRSVKNEEHSGNVVQVPVSVVYDNMLPQIKTLRNNVSSNTSSVKEVITETTKNVPEVIIDTSTELQSQHVMENNKITTDLPNNANEKEPVVVSHNRTKAFSEINKTTKTLNVNDESNIIIPRGTATDKQREETNNTSETTTKNVNSQVNTSNIEKETGSELKKKNKLDIQTSTTTEKTSETVLFQVNENKEIVNKNENNLNYTAHENNEPERKSKLIRQRDPIVPIIENTNNIFTHGKFDYSYEGGDGTKSFQSGVLKEYENKNAGEAVHGGFSYKDKDGQDFELTYTADENGYRPVGAHLPTPPPIPLAIARALQYLATKTTPAPATKSIQDLE